MKKQPFLYLLALAWLSGTAYAEPTRTVEWYRNHPSERVAQLSACRDNPGELGKTPNCINAERAEAIAEAARTGVIHFRPLTAAEMKQRYKELQEGATFGR